MGRVSNADFLFKRSYICPHPNDWRLDPFFLLACLVVSVYRVDHNFSQDVDDSKKLLFPGAAKKGIVGILNDILHEYCNPDREQDTPRQLRFDRCSNLTTKCARVGASNLFIVIDANAGSNLAVTRGLSLLLDCIDCIDLLFIL